MSLEHLQIILSRPGSESLDPNAYQWQVLRALTDEVDSESTPRPRRSAFSSSAPRPRATPTPSRTGRTSFMARKA
ncbi:hypothetical protein GCM10029992_63850 [Glycomyces albus]